MKRLVNLQDVVVEGKQGDVLAEAGVRAHAEGEEEDAELRVCEASEVAVVMMMMPFICSCRNKK
jgi:hypothetical protein